MEQIAKWIADRKITEVEAMVPDQSGIARGKIVPAEKFIHDEGMRLPESVFLQTVTGDYPKDEGIIHPADIDVRLKPDPDSIRVVPWAADPTAQVLHDCFYMDGRPVKMSPRYVLRRVVDLYARKGWKPVVAPELEFFLVKPNTDADYPLEPPVGRSGRAETGRQSFSLDAVNEFDPLFEDVYDYCEAQRIEIDTLIHEAGAAQMEINLVHGDPLELADQAFLFKRTVRETALRHHMYATFMAKPMEKEPGSAMHVHQSVVEIGAGRNVFSDKDGHPSQLFFSYIAGLQKYLPCAMPFFAPYVNSYRRITRFGAAPINVEWGYDNRTAGLRAPHASPSARRVENRLPGADVNPYVAIAVSLACGYLGMLEKLEPTAPLDTSAYDKPYSLPRSLLEGLDLLHACTPLREVLGERFVKAYSAVKRAEYETYLQVISSWEREHLLLNA